MGLCKSRLFRASATSVDDMTRSPSPRVESLNPKQINWLDACNATPRLSYGAAMRLAVVCAVSLGCSQPAVEHLPASPIGAPNSPGPSNSKTITIIGTNDLHGALDRLPIFAGFVANVRAARAADGGGVVLVDAGDIFQGTLESNLAEGADVIRAYNQLGYTAAAIGNHEFDYGPVGPKVTPQTPADDPRGALKARLAEAAFPFVVTNIVDKQTDARIAWENAPASVIVEVAGVKVGILGATTTDTPQATMPANFAGLRMARPTAKIVAAEAKRLRDQGAVVVVLTAHIGGACKNFDSPDDTSSCDRDEELFELLRDVPAGRIDVVVAGHTHAAVAHRYHGTAVIESYSSGRAFGRVDVQVTDRRITNVKIHKPKVMCSVDAHTRPIPAEECRPRDYEGRPVVVDPAVARIVDQSIARAGTRRSEKLGVTIAKTITRARQTESALGNWVTDLMLVARPEAQVALTNGGGLRADIPAGKLTYGQLFTALPFDNRFAIVELEGRYIRQLIITNLQYGGSFLSWAGLTAKVRCQDGRLDATIQIAGQPLEDHRTYKVATSDFLASGGGDTLARLKLPSSAITVTDVIIRDRLAEVLRGDVGAPPAGLPKPFTPATRRVDYVGKRPLVCGRATSKAEEP